MWPVVQQAEFEQFFAIKDELIHAKCKLTIVSGLITLQIFDFEASVFADVLPGNEGMRMNTLHGRTIFIDNIIFFIAV